MPLILRYGKEKRVLFFVMLLSFVIFFTASFLYRLPLAAVFYSVIVSLLPIGIYLFWDFGQYRKKHEMLSCISDITDLISEHFPEGSSLLEEDYRRILDLLKEEHLAFRDQTDRRYAEMIDYYTVWGHQIKTPIASMRLHLQNEDSPLSRKLSADLFRIEQYVEMVLAFLRLDAKDTDYVIKECDVDMLIRQTAKKFAGEFIYRKLRFDYSPLNMKTISDEKWLSFVLEQIFSNALKYTAEGSISVTEIGKGILCIGDTGIGIAESDLPRIFEKGYTGENGRLDKKASGIGLWLCKRVCLNLHHKIWAESELGKGTAIYIDLSADSMKFD